MDEELNSIIRLLAAIKQVEMETQDVLKSLKNQGRCHVGSGREFLKYNLLNVGAMVESLIAVLDELSMRTTESA